MMTWKMMRTKNFEAYIEEAFIAHGEALNS